MGAVEDKEGSMVVTPLKSRDAAASAEDSIDSSFGDSPPCRDILASRVSAVNAAVPDPSFGVGVRREFSERAAGLRASKKPANPSKIRPNKIENPKNHFSLMFVIIFLM